MNFLEAIYYARMLSANIDNERQNIMTTCELDYLITQIEKSVCYKPIYRRINTGIELQVNLKYFKDRLKSRRLIPSQAWVR